MISAETTTETSAAQNITLLIRRSLRTRRGDPASAARLNAPGTESGVSTFRFGQSKPPGHRPWPHR